MVFPQRTLCSKEAARAGKVAGQGVRAASGGLPFGVGGMDPGCPDEALLWQPLDLSPVLVRVRAEATSQDNVHDPQEQQAICVPGKEAQD